MMRLAMAAFLLLAAMAAPTEAQSLPKAEVAHSPGSGR